MKKLKYVFLTIVLASVVTMISVGQMFGDDQQVKPLMVYSVHSEHSELVPVSESKYSIKLSNRASEVFEPKYSIKLSNGASEVFEPKYSIKLFNGTFEVFEPKNTNEFHHFVGIADENSAFQIIYDGKDASDVFYLGETIMEYFTSDDYTYQRGQLVQLPNNRKVSLKNAPVKKCLLYLDFGFNGRDSLLIHFDTGSRHSYDR